MPVWLGRRFPPDQLVSGGTWPQLPGQSSGCEDKLCLWVRVATFCPLLLLLLPPPPPPDEEDEEEVDTERADAGDSAGCASGGGCCLVMFLKL